MAEIRHRRLHTSNPYEKYSDFQLAPRLDTLRLFTDDARLAALFELCAGHCEPGGFTFAHAFSTEWRNIIAHRTSNVDSQLHTRTTDQHSTPNS